MLLSWATGSPFPVATCRPLMSLAAKREKLLAMILLPLETRKVARGNSRGDFKFKCLSPKLYRA